MKLPNFLIVKKINDTYNVKHLFYKFKDVTYKSLNMAIDLCRLRTNNTLSNDNMKFIKIPFVNTWFAF